MLSRYRIFALFGLLAFGGQIIRAEGGPVNENAGEADRRYPIIGKCTRCDREYFDLRFIMSGCLEDGCDGYITGMTREELDEYSEASDDDRPVEGENDG